MTKKHTPPSNAGKDIPEAEYQRFLQAAREVEASENAEDFDKAVKKVAKTHSPPQNQ